MGDTRSTATGSSARVGYTRVSTVSQTLDQEMLPLQRQERQDLLGHHVQRRDDRPGLAALMNYIRDGDTVVAWKTGWPALHIFETVQGSDPGDLLTLTLVLASSRPSKS